MGRPCGSPPNRSEIFPALGEFSGLARAFFSFPSVSFWLFLPFFFVFLIPAMPLRFLSSRAVGFSAISLGASAVLLGSCTTVVRTGPQASAGSGEAPLFGAGGTRPTIGSRTGSSQTTVATTERRRDRAPRPREINVDPGSTTTTTASTTTAPASTAGTVTSTASTTTGSGAGTATTTSTQTAPVATTPAKPKAEERYGRPVPGRDDIIVNPFDPNGPPLKIKNLSSGRADYQSGDRLRNPNNPNEHIIVP